jgi:hypothetical protein
MQLSPLEIALLAGTFAAFWLGMRMSAVRALILIGLVHMSLQHVRQEAMLGALAPLILAEPLGRALGRSAGAQPIRWRMPLPQAALGGALIAAVLVGRVSLQVQRVDGPTAPVTALVHVPPQLRAQPVLNDYDFGGYLIFAGIRPYIDGRADMYGDDFVNEYLAIAGGAEPDVDDTFKHYNITWTILGPKEPLVAVLDHRPGWRRLYADDFAVVQVRDDALPPAPTPAPAGAAAAPPALTPPPASASNGAAR